MDATLLDLMRQVNELKARVTQLETRERPNQALDTASSVTHDRLMLGTATGAVTGDMLASGLIETSHGTWTPAFVGTTIAGTFTYTTQLGRYIKIGKRCWLDFNVHISVVTVAATGNLTITGLPFASVTAAGYAGMIPVACDKVTVLGTTVQLMGRVASNVVVIDFIETGNNIAATLLPASAISAGTTIEGSFCYETA